MRKWQKCDPERKMQQICTRRKTGKYACKYYKKCKPATRKQFKAHIKKLMMGLKKKGINF